MSERAGRSGPSSVHPLDRAGLPGRAVTAVVIALGLAVTDMQGWLVGIGASAGMLAAARWNSLRSLRFVQSIELTE